MRRIIWNSLCFRLFHIIFVKYLVKEFLSLLPGEKFSVSQNPEEILSVEPAVEMEDNGCPVLWQENGMTHCQIDWFKQMNRIFLFIVFVIRRAQKDRIILAFPYWIDSLAQNSLFTFRSPPPLMHIASVIWKDFNYISHLSVSCLISPLFIKM